MNRMLLKSIVTSSALMAAIGYTGIASAHCFDNLGLAASAGSADVYRVHCFKDTSGASPSMNDTSKLFTRVQLQSATVAGQSVGAQIGKEGSTQSTLVTDASFTTGDVTDPTGLEICDAPNASRQTALVGGNGDYNILISKRGGSAKTYGMVFHCQDTGGIETGTSEVINGFTSPELAGNATFANGVTPTSADIDLIIDR